MSDSAQDKIRVRCQCGVKLKVPASASGRRARCPSCNNTFVIPEPSAASAGPPISEPVEPTEKRATARPRAAAAPPAEESLLDAFAASESAAEATSAPAVVQASPTCPNCGKPMVAGDARCGLCGHDQAAAKRQKSAGKKVVAAAAGNLAKAGGRFMLGCVFSAVGALIGAGVWYGVAIHTGFEIGYIAVGLGVAAGFGMLLGSGDQSLKGGLAAAGISFGGIMAAKMFLLSWFLAQFSGFDQFLIASHRADWRADQDGLSPYCQRRSDYYDEEMQKLEGLAKPKIEEAMRAVDAWNEGGKWDHEDYPRVYLIHDIATKNYEEDPAFEDAVEIDGEIFDEEAEAELWTKHYEAAVAEVDSMNAEDVLAEARRRSGGEDQERQDVFGGEEDDADLDEAFTVWSLFGVLDIVFILLAIGAAFKIAGGDLDD